MSYMKLGIIVAVCSAQVAFAAPVIDKTISYTYTHNDTSNESCDDYLDVKVVQQDMPDKEHRFCAGGKVTPVNAEDDVVFVQLKGGNGGGWGLYRYNITKDKIEEYQFYASVIYISQKDYNGVWLQVYHSRYGQHGRMNDVAERWYWSFDKDKPVKK